MAGPDPEIEQLKDAVSCAVFLERASDGWQIDKSDSSRNAIKYRRGPGETIIVNHQGRGWWNPQGPERGDVISLAQFPEPGLNFGEVRSRLRQVAGMPDTASAAAIYHKLKEKAEPDVPVIDRWNKRRPIRPGSPAWKYLAETRHIPEPVLHAAAAQDAVREGPYASAWFAHRDEVGKVIGIESRGPAFQGFSEGGDKTLFRLSCGTAPPSRLAVNEGSIDALSLAALEQLRPDTLYVATGGGIGPHTEAALKEELAKMAGRPGARLTIATDNDPAGERHAGRLTQLARDAGVPPFRLRPPGIGNDWNNLLEARATGSASTAPDAPAATALASASTSTPASSTGQQEPTMSDTTTTAEPPHATRAQPGSDSIPAAAQANAGAPANTSASAAAGAGATEPALAAKADAGTSAAPQPADPRKDPLYALLLEMQKLAVQMPGAQGEEFKNSIDRYLAQAAKPGALDNEMFRTNIAWVAVDMEKFSGQKLEMAPPVRSEVEQRAFSVPGLDNLELKRVLGATKHLMDQPLVDEIREQAIKVAGEPYMQQLGQEVRNSINDLSTRIMDSLSGVGDRRGAIDIKQEQTGAVQDVQSKADIENTKVSTVRQAETQSTSQKAASAGGEQEQANSVTIKGPSLLGTLAQLGQIVVNNLKERAAQASSPEQTAEPPAPQQASSPSAASTASPAPAAPAVQEQGMQAAAQPAPDVLQAKPAAFQSAIETRVSQANNPAPSQAEPRSNATTSPSPSAALPAESQPGVGTLSTGTLSTADAASGAPAATFDSRHAWTNVETPLSRMAEQLAGRFKPDAGQQAEADRPPPWASGENQLQSRVDSIADRMSREGVRPQMEKAEQSAMTASLAVNEFLSGPGRDMHGKIYAAAQTEPGGMETVLSEMRPGGKYAGLRSDFDSAMQQNQALAQSYDNVARSIDTHGKDRIKLEQQYHRYERDTGEIGQKFKDTDETLGRAASELPGREPGKSLMQELGEKIEQLFNRVTNAIRHAFGMSASVGQNHEQRPGGDMSMGR